ncbi:unnamed protein product, partial [Effrenium voratum]
MALAELGFLARWAQPGLAPLRHVVLGPDALSSPLILKRLNKQLGPGMGCKESTDCVLRDIQEGLSKRRRPAQAARQLLSVGRVLC